MALNVEVIEERLKSFLSQLQAESGILDRIIYKNKNQHRRCSYFQYLAKVRRNLKLLLSVHLEDLLESCFHVITGRKGKQKAHLLESLKRSKVDTGKFNFLDRLLGVARLLSQMVEPMLKTATEISTLLARSFFMGFSLMVLSLLARLRVLVQQMLLDVVSVFNEVTDIAQKKQLIKITQDGIEVFREYYPAMEHVVTLECDWRTDKFMLIELVVKGEDIQDENVKEEQASVRTPVKYLSIDAFFGDIPPDSEKTDTDNPEQSASNLKRKRPEHEKDDPEKVLVEQCSISSVISSSFELESRPSKRVAFVSVKKPVPSAPNLTTSQVNEMQSKSHDDTMNPLFNLLNGKDTKGSIF